MICKLYLDEVCFVCLFCLLSTGGGRRLQDDVGKEGPFLLWEGGPGEASWRVVITELEASNKSAHSMAQQSAPKRGF